MFKGKISKFCLIILMSIIMIFLGKTTSNASKITSMSSLLDGHQSTIGDYITVGYANKTKNTFKLKGNSNLYCIQHGGSLSSWSTNKYYVKTYIYIKGDVAYIYKSNSSKYIAIQHKSNAVLAYIIAGGNYSKGYKSTRQYALWKYWDNWIDDVGREAGLSSWDTGDSGSANSLYKEALEYANKGSSISQAYIENKSGDSIVCKSRTNVGPFNISKSGDIDKIEVKFTDGSTGTIDSKNTTSVYATSSRNGGRLSSLSKIGNTFYLRNTTAKTIKSIKIYVNKKATDTVYIAKLYLLKTNKGTQRLMAAKPGSQTTESGTSITADVTIDIDTEEPPKDPPSEEEEDFERVSLIIGKKDGTTGESLADVGFKIYCVDGNGKGGWLKYNPNTSNSSTNLDKYDKNNISGASSYYSIARGSYSTRIWETDVNKDNVNNYYNANARENAYDYNASYNNSTTFVTPSLGPYNYDFVTEKMKKRSAIKIAGLKREYTFYIIEVSNPNAGYSGMVIDDVSISKKELGENTATNWNNIDVQTITIDSKEYQAIAIPQQYQESHSDNADDLDVWTAITISNASSEDKNTELTINKVRSGTDEPLDASFKIKVFRERNGKKTELGWLAGWNHTGFTYENTFDDADLYRTYKTSGGTITFMGLRHTFEGYTYSYSVYEVEPPEGYSLKLMPTYIDENGGMVVCRENVTLKPGENVTINIPNRSSAGFRIIKQGETEGDEDFIDNVSLDAGFQIYNASTKQWVVGNDRTIDEDGIYSYTSFSLSNTMPTEPIYTTEGTLEVTGLSKGRYYIYEAEAPYGYDLEGQDGYRQDPSGLTLGQDNGWVYWGYVDVNTTIVDVEKPFVNKITVGNLEIIKQDPNKSTQSEMKTGFKIYYNDESQWLYLDNNEDIQYTSNQSDASILYTTYDSENKINSLELGGLKEGTYTIYEVVAPDGYYLEGQTGFDETNNWVNCGTVELPSNNMASITIDNYDTINISGYVWVDVPQSKDNDYNSIYDDNETRLEGITVKLVNKSNGSVVSTTTTGSDGSYIFEKVLIGQIDELYIQFDYSGTEYKQYIPVAFNNSNAAGSRALYDEVPEYDANLSGIVSTYQGTTQESTYGLSGTLYSNFYNSSNNTLENINLGIKELPNTDYTLEENVADAVITIGDGTSGWSYTYEYGGRGTIISDSMPTVNWEDYSNGIYASSVDIYPSDIAYAEMTGNDIKVTVTYRIDITNTENFNITELYVEKALHITSLTDEFDTTRYELADSNWTASGNTATITNEYLNEIYGNGGLGIEETGTAYITFRLTEQAILDILNNPEGIIENNPTKATSIAHHEYERRDYSWNNNLTATQTHYTESQTKEDDAPYLRFELAEDRQASGTLFEDEDVTSNAEIVGNGEYDEGENKVSGATVELIDSNTNSTAKLYTINTSLTPGSAGYYVESDAIFTTGTDGTYALTGIIPGDYYIRYTYGDGTQIIEAGGNTNVAVGEYKSTIVSNEVIKQALEDDTNSNKDSWYKEIAGENYSVAVDNLDIREEYNEKVLNNESLDDNKTIYAESALFEIAPIVSSEETNGFNFGIIKLPEQKLTLDQIITNITLTNSQGNVILSGEPGVDVMSGVTTPDLVDGGNGSAYVRIELDQQETYGSKLTITYEVIVTNESELNFYEEETSEYYGWYYKYGDKTDAQEVTITANEVLDYLDPTLTYVSSDPENMVEELTKENENWYGEDGNIVDNNDKIKTAVEEQEAYMEYEYTREENYEKILSITEWEELQSIYTEDEGAQTSDVVEITAERLLTIEDDDMNFITTVEIITPDPSPEPLIPKEIELPDPEDAVTEITPPTGANMQNIVIYSIAGIVSLITIGIGIVLIKKKVL